MTYLVHGFDVPLRVLKELIDVVAKHLLEVAVFEAAPLRVAPLVLAVHPGPAVNAATLGAAISLLESGSAFRALARTTHECLSPRVHVDAVVGAGSSQFEGSCIRLRLNELV